MCSPKLLLMTLWLVLSVSAQDDVVIKVEKKAGRHYCGETLNRALMLICDSTYKRSGPTDEENVDWMGNEPQANRLLYDFPFRRRNAAVALIPRQYKRQGVADECCSKPCTVSELSTYCGAKPRH